MNPVLIVEFALKQEPATNDLNLVELEEAAARDALVETDPVDPFVGWAIVHVVTTEASNGPPFGETATVLHLEAGLAVTMA